MYMGEEDAFWMLHALLRGAKFNLHGLYSPGFPLLHQFFYQLEYLIQKDYPRVYKHMKALEISPVLYAPQWFITLFAYSFPMETLLRIWDVILHEGLKTVFKMSMWVIKHVEKELYKMDFMEMVRCLKDVFDREIVRNPDYMVREVLKVKISKKLLDQVAKQYEIQNEKLKAQKQALKLKKEQKKNKQKPIDNDINNNNDQINNNTIEHDKDKDNNIDNSNQKKEDETCAV